MRRVVLERLSSTDQGTFGKIVVDGIPFFTGELPWRGNHSSLSCIPPGIYQVVWVYSPRFKRRTYMLQGVEKRSMIRIHPANFMGDSTKGYYCQLNGCIALSEKIGTMERQKALLVSAPAVSRFERLMAEMPFELEIIDRTKLEPLETSEISKKEEVKNG